MITVLKYGATNTYVISGTKGSLMFDTCWAGSFPLMCKALGEQGLKLQDIRYLLISHFHPDHMGIAQNIADAGVTIAAASVQKGFLHASDGVFAKENKHIFKPIDDAKVRFFETDESGELLSELGIDGEVLHTPGHSDDSISLWLKDERALFVGDLNPLYELEMHKGTRIEKSWQMLLALRPDIVYYGHAKPAQLSGRQVLKPISGGDVYALVKKITRLTDKGCDTAKIAAKTGADPEFIRDVRRMYVTHPGVSVQGILDRIEIKGR